jgi:hypothetical protein
MGWSAIGCWRSLGEPAFTALRLEGRALLLEAAIAEALATS